MKSRESIEHAIFHAEEKRLGEESVAHRITIDDHEYYAKQWRGKHQRGYQESPYYVEDSDRSPVSPFWVKLKFWEHHLMHEAFPDQIVAMPGAYDPRISNDGKTFDFEHGRPVSLTKVVETTKVLQDERDRIIKPLYDSVQRHERRGKRDLVKQVFSFESVPVHYLVHEVDEGMRKRFGEDLGIRPYVNLAIYDSEVVRQRFIRTIESKFPNTRMAELVKAGILPTHAEANWIPTGEADERGVKGVVIEASIFDPERLRQKLIEARRGKKKQLKEEDQERIAQYIDQELYRFYLLQQIDAIYNQIFFSEEKEGIEGANTNPVVRKEVFRLLERIRQRYDKEKIFFDDDFFSHLRVLLIWVATNQEQQRKEAVERTDEWINNWKPQQQEQGQAAK